MLLNTSIGMEMMNNPRIAHIGWLASCHLRRRAEALSAMGCAEVVYTDNIPDYLDISSLPYTVQVLPPELADKPLALLDWLNEDLSSRNIDILHSHSTHYPACLGFFCSGVVRVNSIWDFVYSKDPLSPLYHRAVLEGLESGQFAEAISFSSPVVRNEWLDRGMSPKRAVLHSWGVDLDIFRPVDESEVMQLRKKLGIASDELVILSSRTTSLPANLDILIKSVAKLRESLPVRLVVIGGVVTREARYLEGLLSQKEVRDAVIFSGSLCSDLALRTYYQMATFVASIHSNDHNPATVLESLAMRTPVVTCDIPTVSYWAREGETGFVVPHRDVEATTNVLRDALGLDDEALQEMGRIGHELVLSEANFPKTLSQVKTDYDRLAEMPKAKPLDEYGMGLLYDMRGFIERAADLYDQGGLGETPELVDELLREKQALLSTERDLEYFCVQRAQPGVVNMAQSPESEWTDLAQLLPPPLSLFRHDFITGVYPLLKTDPERCLSLLSVLADHFDCDLRDWLAEAVQWFGAVLGLWKECGKLLMVAENGGSTLAIHALGCARTIGVEGSLYIPLLERAVVWSTPSIEHIAPELDKLFRVKTHGEAVALLAGQEYSPSVIEKTRVYLTTDRPWTSL